MLAQALCPFEITIFVSLTFCYVLSLEYLLVCWFYIDYPDHNLFLFFKVTEYVLDERL